MYSLEDIRSRSVSEVELVVGYTDSMELLYIFEQAATPIYGWRGWLVFQDGSITHSKRHQGISDLSSLPWDSAIHLAKSSIMQAYTESHEIDEADGTELYFCIAVSA